jgi:hypothetical protein
MEFRSIAIWVRPGKPWGLDPNQGLGPTID